MATKQQQIKAGMIRNARLRALRDAAAIAAGVADRCQSLAADADDDETCSGLLADAHTADEIARRILALTLEDAP